MNKWNKIATTPERIKEALKNANMKQVELSNATGLDKGAISCYISGKYEPKSDAINKMAIALNVNEMWLWGYDVPMEREKKTPDNIKLTESEEKLLEIFRLIPEEQQRVFLDMGRVYADSLKKD